MPASRCGFSPTLWLQPDPGLPVQPWRRQRRRQPIEGDLYPEQDGRYRPFRLQLQPARAAGTGPAACRRPSPSGFPPAPA